MRRPSRIVRLESGSHCGRIVKRFSRWRGRRGLENRCYCSSGSMFAPIVSVTTLWICRPRSDRRLLGGLRSGRHDKSRHDGEKKNRIHGGDATFGNKCDWGSLTGVRYWYLIRMQND